MKLNKSKASMIGYAAALLSVIVFSKHIADNQIDLIVLAVTASGLIFAISDCLSFVSERDMELSEYIKKKMEYFLKLNDKYRQLNTHEEKVALTYIKKYGNNGEYSKTCLKVLERVESNKKTLKKRNEYVENLNNAYKIKEGKSRFFSVISIATWFIGFVAFLIIVFFKVGVPMDTFIGNGMTITTFSIIMITYCMKDSREDEQKTKKHDIEINKMKFEKENMDIEEQEKNLNTIDGVINDFKEIDNSQKMNNKRTKVEKRICINFVKQKR